MSNGEPVDHPDRETVKVRQGTAPCDSIRSADLAAARSSRGRSAAGLFLFWSDGDTEGVALPRIKTIPLTRCTGDTARHPANQTHLEDYAGG